MQRLQQRGVRCIGVGITYAACRLTSGGWGNHKHLNEAEFSSEVAALGVACVRHGESGQVYVFMEDDPVDAERLVALAEAAWPGKQLVIMVTAGAVPPPEGHGRAAALLQYHLEREDSVDELVRECLLHFHPGVLESFVLKGASPSGRSYRLTVRKEAVRRLRLVGFPVDVLDSAWSFEVRRIPTQPNLMR